MSDKNSDVIIAHISDLHFGNPKHVDRAGIMKRIEDEITSLKGLGIVRNFLGLGIHGEDKKRDLKTIITEIKPHVIVVSGDITTIGDPKSFEDAFYFLMTLKLPIDRIIAVPGNHDVLWGKLNKFSIIDKFKMFFGLKAESPLSRWYKKYFGMKIKNVTSGDEIVGIQQVDINGTTIDFLIYDSTREELYHVSDGRVDSSQFDFINRSKNRLREDSLRIAVLHHHPLPIPYSKDRSLTIMTNGGTFMEHCQAMGVDIILHGHEHCESACRVKYWTRYRPQQEQEKDIYVIAAGSALQEKADSSFNVIRISEQNKLKLEVWHHTPTGFQRLPDRDLIWTV